MAAAVAVCAAAAPTLLTRHTSYCAAPCLPADAHTLCAPPSIRPAGRKGELQSRILQFFGELDPASSATLGRSFSARGPQQQWKIEQAGALRGGDCCCGGIWLFVAQLLPPWVPVGLLQVLPQPVSRPVWQLLPRPPHLLLPVACCSCHNHVLSVLHTLLQPGWCKTLIGA